MESSFSKYFLNHVGLHSSNTANIDFSGFGLQGSGDEGWGIDNIKVYLFGVNALAPCQHVETVVITEPNELDASAVKNSNVTCFGGNEGSATGSAIGGTVVLITNIHGMILPIKIRLLLLDLLQVLIK